MEVTWISRTEMSCPGKRFDPFVLEGKWKIMISENALAMSKTGTILFFSGSYAPLTNLPFVNKNLKLYASNDTSFNMMKEYRMLPVLKLGEDRIFELKWNIQPDDTTFPYNYLQGPFDITYGQQILFNSKWSSFASSNIPPYEAGDLFFEQRVSKSTRFTFSGETFTLSGNPEGFYYSFVPD